MPVFWWLQPTTLVLMVTANHTCIATMPWTHMFWCICHSPNLWNNWQGFLNAWSGKTCCQELTSILEYGPMSSWISLGTIPLEPGPLLVVEWPSLTGAGVHTLTTHQQAQVCGCGSVGSVPRPLWSMAYLWTILHRGLIEHSPVKEGKKGEVSMISMTITKLTRMTITMVSLTWCKEQFNSKLIVLYICYPTHMYKLFLKLSTYY